MEKCLKKIHIFLCGIMRGVAYRVRKYEEMWCVMSTNELKIKIIFKLSWKLLTKNVHDDDDDDEISK
jgi:uncharacterized membrane protein